MRGRRTEPTTPFPELPIFGLSEAQRAIITEFWTVGDRYTACEIAEAWNNGRSYTSPLSFRLPVALLAEFLKGDREARAHRKDETSFLVRLRERMEALQEAENDVAEFRDNYDPHDTRYYLGEVVQVRLDDMNEELLCVVREIAGEMIEKALANHVRHTPHKED